MITRAVIVIAGLVVAIFSMAVGDWWGVAAVVVVLAAIFRWRPSWLRVESPERLTETQIVVRLAELRSWRRLLVPCSCVAVGVQAWALHGVLTRGELFGVSVLMSVVASLLVAWAAVTHRSVERLEDWLAEAGELP